MVWNEELKFQTGGLTPPAQVAIFQSFIRAVAVGSASRKFRRFWDKGLIIVTPINNDFVFMHYFSSAVNPLVEITVLTCRTWYGFAKPCVICLNPWLMMLTPCVWHTPLIQLVTSYARWNKIRRGMADKKKFSDNRGLFIIIGTRIKGVNTFPSRVKILRMFFLKTKPGINRPLVIKM